MAHPLLKLYAGRDNHVRFDAFGVERLFIGRTLARKPETQGGKLAQLHTETVVEIARQTVYEVGQHVFHMSDDRPEMSSAISCSVLRPAFTGLAYTFFFVLSCGFARSINLIFMMFKFKIVVNVFRSPRAVFLLRKQGGNVLPQGDSRFLLKLHTCAQKFLSVFP